MREDARQEAFEALTPVAGSSASAISHKTPSVNPARAALGQSNPQSFPSRPSGYLSGAYLAAVVFDLVRGALLADALRGADELLAREQECEETAEATSRAVVAANAGTLTAAAIEALGGGWVGEEALAIGIACAISCRSAAEIPATLWRAVAHAGDSDSTGSIAGNLLGAIYGATALPSRWLVQLELRGVVERAARDLFASSVLGCKLDNDFLPTRTRAFQATRLTTRVWDALSLKMRACRRWPRATRARRAKRRRNRQ